MAIIGNAYKLEKFFKDKNLDVVFNYLKECLDENSDVHKRILSSSDGSCEKIMLTDEIFALEQVFLTKDREEMLFESHKKYIDFQMIICGNEQMEYIDIDKLEVENQYDESRDLILYKLSDDSSKIVLQNQDLAIFFPDDGHIGLTKYKKSEVIYKAVVKLPINFWNK